MAEEPVDPAFDHALALSLDATERWDNAGLNQVDNTLLDNLSTIGESPDGDTQIEGNLGTLEKLPHGVLWSVLAQLDVCTVRTFRRVNRQAQELVDALTHYNTINTHAPHVIPAILSIEAGRWISCGDLWKAFCTATCEECGRFANFLYIPTCKKVCFYCFTGGRTIAVPFLYEDAREMFGVTDDILQTLPNMLSIPGTYGPDDFKTDERFPLVDRLSAYFAGIERHGSRFDMERYASEKLFDKRSQAWEEAGKQRRRPRLQDYWDEEEKNIWSEEPNTGFRFMAVVHLAPFNRLTQEFELGFSCVACLGSCERHTVASFREHINQYGNIQEGDPDSWPRAYHVLPM
ncbi:hypothetical protein PV08_07238 [Exophiala spinifera]|uniref:F-box domain-containing protein n=1 Tax=Exophiala spinifera TaxID=91928 RepID=A0A0D2BT86_9EURO|nr:uncharacterized protein PV08_07238 [Exophiala spinifera]KIW14454.1 hypothetical protein PV08_07238 [Exophiala spinifera]